MDIQTICGSQELNGDYITIDNIPNSTNKIFTYNEYIGDGGNDGYLISHTIISEKEVKTILDYWNELQDIHETRFEVDYMNSVLRSCESNEAQQEEEFE